MSYFFCLAKGLKESETMIHKNTIFIEDGCTERQDDEAYENTKNFAKLEHENMSSIELNNLFEGFQTEKNELLDYKKYDILTRKNYEEHDAIWNRFETLYENLGELALKEKKNYFYIVVSHGASLEMFSHLNYNRRCNAGYCSTNLISNKWK